MVARRPIAKTRSYIATGFTFTRFTPVVLTCTSNSPSRQELLSIAQVANFRQNWDGGVVNPGGIQGGSTITKCDYRRLQAMHTGAMTAGLGDGSVRTLSASISALTFQRLCDPKDGQVLGGDWE